jgi:hypothetical protein
VIEDAAGAVPRLAEATTIEVAEEVAMVVVVLRAAEARVSVCS